MISDLDLTDEQNQLFGENMKLAFFYAAQWHRAGYGSMDIDDLNQEALIGLAMSTKDFDPQKGKFSTHAKYRIRQRLGRLTDNTCSTVRVPVPVRQLNRQLARGDCIEDSARLAAGRVSFHNLDAPINGCDGATFQETLAVELGCEVYSDDERSFMPDDFKVLSVRELDIINRRFGFNDVEIETLEEISKTYQCTKEWIRQIEFKALRKLRIVFERRRIGCQIPTITPKRLILPKDPNRMGNYFMKNMNDIRAMLCDEIEKLRTGKTDPATVNAITKATGQILATVKLEMEYAKSKNDAARQIGMLEIAEKVTVSKPLDSK